MSERNAIELLREALTEAAKPGLPQYGDPSSWDALAAVDALYQAAKRVVEHEAAYADLLAAVRRIEGDAT